jgi:hypothetical protein
MELTQEIETMGTITHTIITVTSEIPLHIHLMWAEAIRIFGESVSEPVSGTVNGSQTFIIAPSGSKDGWPQADAHDAKVAEFTDIIYRTEHGVDALMITFNRDTNLPKAWIMRNKDD